MIAWNIAGDLAGLSAQEIPPSFTLQPTGAVVYAGQDLQLVAEASGNPVPALQWQFNGNDLPDQTASILSLGFLATNQSGIYRLRASNSVGVVYSDDAVVTVLPVYPEILIQPTNVTVFEGDTVALQVQSRPTPGVSIIYVRWQKDGVALEEEFPVLFGVGSQKLQMPYIGLTNSGSYNVVIQNDYGSVTSEVAVVTVQPALTTAGWVDTNFANGAGFNGRVNALAVQPDGKVLVGGAFTSFNEMPRFRIARLNLDGTLDATFSTSNAVNGEVLALALQADGKILVGGRFNSIGGFAQNHLARLNADGSADTSFVMNPPLLVPSIDGETVSSILVLTDGRILHAGTSYWLGRRQADGSVDPTFQPFIQQFSGGSRNDPIPARCLTLDRDGKLLLGGSSLLGLRRFHATGAPDASFKTLSASTNLSYIYPDVYAVAAFPDGRILIGGSFSQINAIPRRALACFNSDGSLSPSYAGVLTNSCAMVNSIVLLPDGKAIIAGCLNAISGVPTKAGIARLNADGSLDTSFDTSRALIGTSVTTLALRDSGEKLAGGDFSRFGGFLRGSLVQLHGDVPQAPSINIQPAAQTVVEGRKATLFVQATFPPKASYQWLLNGGPVPYATNQILTLPGISFGQAGDYSVVVANAFGSVTSEVAQVVVTLQPMVLGGTDLSYFNGAGADGPVFCSFVLPDGKTLISGAFTSIHGTPRQHVARLNIDGSVDETFAAGPIQLGLRTPFGAELGQGVFAVTADRDGRIYLGGSLTNVGGLVRRGIVRLLPSGAMDDAFKLTNGLNGPVFSIVLQADGKVIIGGGFQPYPFDDGIPRLVTRLNADGSLDNAFASPFSVVGNDWAVYSMLPLSDGRTFLAGRFGVNAFSPRTSLIRIHPNGSNDLSFFGGDLLANVPRALARDEINDRCYVAGASTLNAPEGRTERIGCMMNCDGSFSSFARAHGSVRALSLDAAGRLLVGTTSTNINGVTRTYLARLNLNGELDTNFSVVLDGTVWSVTPRWADDSALITGAFTTVNDVQRGGVARIWGDPVPPPTLTNLPTSQSVASGEPVTLRVGEVRLRGDTVQWFYNGSAVPGANGASLTFLNPLTTHDGQYFSVVSNMSGVATSAVMTLNVAPPDLAPARVDFEFASGAGFGPDAPVYVLALQADGRLLIGGAFSNVQGVARQRIARLNPDGSLDRSFDTSALGTFAPGYSPAMVRAIAIQPDDKVVIGGFFELRRGARFDLCLARLNENGSVDESFLPGFSGDPEVRSLLVESDGQILVGRVNANGILRLRATNGMRDISFQASLDHAALALGRTSDGRIYAGGRFTRANGWTRNRIARFHSTGELDLSFQPGTGANSNVNALAIQPDGKVIIGGVFSSVGGQLRVRVARLNTNGLLDESFDPGLGPNAAVHAVALEHDGSILIAGEFTAVGSTTRARIARLKPDGSLDSNFDPGTGANGTIFVLAPRPEGGAYAGGSFTSFDGAPRTYVTRLHTGVVLTHPQFSASGFMVTVSTATGRTYWLESTDEVSDGTWTPVISVPGNGLIQTLRASPSGAPAFYRVRVE